MRGYLIKVYKTMRGIERVNVHVFTQSRGSQEPEHIG